MFAGKGAVVKDFRNIKDLIKNSMYCSISTITKDGLPHSSPIGSVFLENEEGGYFIEMFTKSMIDKSKEKACIMAVNTSLFFWLISLIKGRFNTHPATRLLVTLGEKRKITEIERAHFQKKVKPFKWLKGYKHMWSTANYVRTFTVDKVIPVSIGKMTKQLEQ
ncbi:hypothetical protein A9Q84_07995 [Halobacteriovorax marinus]|uniref:Uncharacterized protein n=1 Tax=Halobacteriovorax marinus TaxID=97084 RepID=A0A1Y5FBQ2_9BACT|nr:hypothetical protein A9Q84_07995 [Halobacteriovorax marinus]